MEHNLSQIASSYKLNSSIVKRMTSRVIIDSHRNEHPGCSKLMIAAMIHFSHICSTKGVIERIKVSELSFVLRCNIRSAYTVLAELEKREFISVETVDSWNGIKRIIIHDNDYSSVSNYSNVRYLNTNYPFFNYRESNGYVKFLNLSLFSMRLLLLLLLNYKPSYGYRVSYDTACAQLSVKKSFRVHKYMKELEDVLGPNFFVSGKSSNTRRKKHDVIVVVKGQDALTPDKFFSTTQDTYYSF